MCNHDHRNGVISNSTDTVQKNESSGQGQHCLLYNAYTSTFIVDNYILTFLYIPPLPNKMNGFQVAIWDRFIAKEGADGLHSI